MAVRVFCSDPKQLLHDIKTAIRGASIQTWELDQDGDFTHSPTQWKNQAWFRPSFQPGQLVLLILGQKSGRMSKETYAVYHGRFIEMLLAHFDDKFTSATATAQIISGENIGNA